MVIKTEICAFSEYRIYPGTGMLYIRRDCRPVSLGSHKAKCMMEQRMKPAKLVWTQRWRIQNKKGLSETSTKKRVRKVTKISRGVVGLSMDDLKKRATQTLAFRKSQSEEAIKGIKDKKKKEAEEKKAKAKAAAKAAGAKGAKDVVKNAKGQGKRGVTQR